MVRMLISDQLEFPKLREWAKHDLPQIHTNARVWEAFKRHGQLNNFTAFQAVNWIDGSPLLRVKPLSGAFGAFDSDKPDRIVLASEVANRFEIDHTRADARKFVEATILHELVHWGDARDGRDQSGEEGLSFEEDAYDGVVTPYWQAPRASVNIRESDINTLGPHQPRGLRNNNPGNIRVGDDWEGLAKPEDMTPQQREETAFCVFTHPVYGIHAISKILTAYQSTHGLRTIADMIERWAPPADGNDTENYVAVVAQYMGIGPDEPFDIAAPARMMPMVEAIIFFENKRQPYPDDMIERAIAMA